MDNNYIGYARVSSAQQNEDRQIIALTEYGVPKSAIYTDKQSGRDFERTNYKRMLKKLKKGDVLVIKSIDRLGRSYKDVIKQWQYITQEKGADIIVLDMPILNTSLNKDLIGTLISDIVLQLLSYVAENERLNIRQRQAEGIAAAKARGVKFGRPVIFSTDEYIDVFIKYKNKEIGRLETMEVIGCQKTTFYRMMHELEESGKLPKKSDIVCFKGKIFICTYSTTLYLTL
ncbi:MAG: recombinase family protein [Firmicutes bacterium]|nr:recombinase family protein [Bacillota bacterium]